MGRDSSGNYTLPGAYNPVLTGTTITSAWANNTLTDVASALTDSLSRSGKGSMQAALLLLDGTIGAPGLAFGSEQTTGLYRAAASDVRLSVTGVDAWQVNASRQFILSPAGNNVSPQLIISDASSGTIPGIQLGGNFQGRGAYVWFLGTSVAQANVNWMIGNQYNISGAFEITPSTALGGNTFSTPLLEFLAGPSPGQALLASFNSSTGVIFNGNLQVNAGGGGGGIQMEAPAATQSGFLISQSGQSSWLCRMPASTSELRFWSATSGDTLMMDQFLCVGIAAPLNAAPANGQQIGYLEIPQRALNASGPLVLTDRGKHIYINANSLTLTIPANASVAFPVGTAITIFALLSTGTQLAITSDILLWAPSNGTGTRNLAAGAVATIVKTDANRWVLTGVGIT